ncbi:uncharacterized protein [Lepeophtheirus salmonis]|uniref:uncharacterized protein isoform X1 n=1 Tax=Lepeophtheirus salmonis TaxID=72036 RepID=UPI001AE6EBE7|nr:uncharacterized protein LOC121115176 isoform X1 [Lepeophtheirus salmonis]
MFTYSYMVGAVALLFSGHSLGATVDSDVSQQINSTKVIHAANSSEDKNSFWKTSRGSVFSLWNNALDSASNFTEDFVDQFNHTISFNGTDIHDVLEGIIPSANAVYVGAGVGLFCALTGPCLLVAIGFGPAGIILGSIAASCQSCCWGGNTGNPFSFFQSLGATEVSFQCRYFELKFFKHIEEWFINLNNAHNMKMNEIVD